MQKRLINSINEAIHDEMAYNDKIILFGQDVETSLFGDTKYLVDKFGKERVRNTPISEDVMTSMTVGSSLMGYRPICHLMFANFAYTGFDGIANQASKLRFMTGGKVSLPIVFMAVYGAGMSTGAQHSSSIHSVLMNISGIKIVIPSNSYDAHGLMKSAIRDDNPVFFLIPAVRSGEKGDLPDEEYNVNIGEGKIITSGNQITLISFGTMIKNCILATNELKQKGIEVELIDIRTLLPLDKNLIYQSVKKTGRLLIVDESNDSCSAASYISSLCADECFKYLKAPIKRITMPDTSVPYSKSLENYILPSVDNIIHEVYTLAKWKK